eukprot:scaffold434_cov186-Pinguiococcus_pyrenoidosus.AAC.88
MGARLVGSLIAGVLKPAVRVLAGNPAVQNDRRKGGGGQRSAVCIQSRQKYVEYQHSRNLRISGFQIWQDFP